LVLVVVRVTAGICTDFERVQQQKNAKTESRPLFFQVKGRQIFKGSKEPSFLCFFENAREAF
jgi:hypothetical protein